MWGEPIDAGRTMSDEQQATPLPEIRGPWQRLESDCVYDNRWIRVCHERVITPAGSDGIYGVVHFKNRAVGIIPVDDVGHTWLVRQFRYTLNRHCWEIPMGGGALADDPRDIARRELAEEVGLQAAELVELLLIDVSKSVTDEVGVVYLARGLTRCDRHLDDSEADLELRRLPLDEAIAWAMNGTITDVISIAGLLKLRLLCQSAGLAP
jgi:8-oxo-dGTP pyrophosphatase MutT (NUDIX family)